ncbi:MAG: caspase family protein, partial [Pseudonocardiaceae bacterium]
MRGDGRRFLIATAIAHYPRAPQWDRPGLVEARKEIIDLFTGPLGYQHVSDLGLNPTRDQLTTQLRAFCRAAERRPDDLIAVYIAGHGEVLESSHDHVLLTSDTDPDDVADALPTADLARKMLLGTPVWRVVGRSRRSTGSARGAPGYHGHRAGRRAVHSQRGADALRCRAALGDVRGPGVDHRPRRSPLG